MNRALQRARAAAAATGQYLGWDGPHFRGDEEQIEWAEIWCGQGFPFAARFGVLRAGWPDFCYRVATWDEWAQYTEKGELWESWQRGPCHYLGLVAERFALQAAFPEIIGAEPIGQSKPGLKPRESVCNEALQIALTDLGYESDQQRIALIASARKKYPLLAANNPGAFNAKVIAEAKPAGKAVRNG